jgi:hypothetical protein
LIKRAWAKFNGLDIECVCNEDNRKCDSHDCKEYVIKFIEVDRKSDIDDAVMHLKNESTHLRQQIKKFQSKISSDIKKFKI